MVKAIGEEEGRRGGKDGAWHTHGEADIYYHGIRPIEVAIAGVVPDSFTNRVHCPSVSAVCFESRSEFVSGPSTKIKYQYGCRIVLGMVIRGKWLHIRYRRSAVET